MKYNFYYDETEHSREIGFDTITASNFYDNFITSIVGWADEKQIGIEQKYLTFEDKYSYRKSNDELKSTSIKNKQLEFGFASCNKEYVSFLSDFLSLFSDHVRLFFASMSKIEYLINQIFADYHNTFIVDIDLFKYSIIKSLVINKPIEVEKAIYNSPEQFVLEIKTFLKRKIEIDQQDAKLKEREIEAFSQALLILDEVKPPKQFSWDYRPSFIGFKKYLDENSICEYSLLTDREGDKQKTVHAALVTGIINVSDADSKDYFGIRMADMLAGLITKMMKSLCQSLHPTDPDSVTKTLLSSKWFMLNEEQLKLYKQFYHVICELNNSWYKSFCGIYSDDVISLVALLGYINRFQSVEDMKKDATMHGEYFNAYTCQSLEEYYSRMRNKLPIDPISQNDIQNGYFYNQKGAKCYLDVNLQPELPLSRKVTIYYALSVGFGKEGIPLITIQQNGQAYCYRLPQELYDWTLNLVAMANMGENVFPAYIILSKQHEQWIANIM